MCGICGFVSVEPLDAAAAGPVLDRMRASIRHRGPDDSGNFVDRHAALGHQRLSIVDLQGGHQPMADASGRYVIIYNGEIFNHPDLKAELERGGARYRSRSDTETILQLYARDGDAAVERLRGMFAFALWDTALRRLVLVRDRFGVKPLYYVHDHRGKLWFASEIKALIAAGAVRPELHAPALPDYLANHAPSGEETLFAGVRRLAPGTTLTWQDGRITERRYWDLSLDEGTADGDDDELAEEYLARLRESVRLRLMSDVPLGLFLSGGIDSAAICVLMADLMQEPVRTFSVAFHEREANELSFARMMASQCGTDHYETVLTPAGFFEQVPRLIWHEDEPMAHPSSVALNAVAELAAGRVKVVLTGEGSDETLAGYNRYRVTAASLALGDRYERYVPAVVRSGVREALREGSGHFALARKASRTFLGRSSALESLYLENFAVFDRESQARLFSAPMRGRLAGIDPYRAVNRALEDATRLDPVRQMLYADIKTYLPELLMKQDQMSMAASIESRVPFLDHRLVEFGWKLPSRLRLKGLTTKVILRKAMRGRLPAAILTRKKLGFPVPLATWFRGPYAAMLERVLLSGRAIERGLWDAQGVRQVLSEHVAGKRNNAQRLWSLLNLELWHRIWIDSEDLARVRQDLRAAAS
jgi:asparagine synthase (glutamine-hydrolysing)